MELNSNPNIQPIVTLTRLEHFSAAHRLHSLHLTEQENQELYGKCNNPNGHGHNYKVEVTVKGPVDPTTGMVINLQDVKLAAQGATAIVDHKNLDKDVPYFATKVSTTENVTIFMWEEIAKRLQTPNKLFEVAIHETDKNIFRYRGERTGE